MAGLKFIITADDTPFRKILKKLKDDQAAEMRKAMQQVTDITDTEKKKRKEVIATINQETQAIKKRNQEEANRPVRKAVLSEVAAYQKSQTGTISSGSVAGQHAELGKLANAATAASVAQEKLAVTTQSAAKAATAQEINTQRLALRLQSYKNISNTTFDPKVREQYNLKIQETEQQIARLSNVGKKGFDEFGNKIKSSGNLIGKLFGGVRQLAYILPGIGIAGIFSLALDPLFELIAGMELFKGKISDAAKNLMNYNEVNRNAARTAGEQITTLKILYSTATDVAIAEDKRKKAAQELQKIFPEAFKNSKIQAILNGEEKRSYDELTESIVKNARAKAAKDKLDEIESQRLELDFQRRKIRVANVSETRRNQALRGGTRTFIDQETGEERTVKVKDEAVDRRIADSNKRAKESLKILAERDKVLQAQESFLVRYVGKENIASVIENKNGKQRIATESQYQTALAKRQDILNTLKSITDEFNRKSLTEEEAGRIAVVDRFEELRRQLIKYNTWALNYNKTAKKDQKVGLISLDSLDPVQNRALEQYDAKVQVDAAKRTAEQMKQVYAQYEDYRTQYGEAAADKRFADELQGAKSYIEYLRNQMDSFAWDDSALGNGMKDFFIKELPKAHKEADQKSFDEMIKMVVSYEEQRKGIQERYAKLRAQTTDQNQIIILNKNQKEELDALDDANVQKLDAYKALYGGIENLSDKAAKAVIANAEEMLQALLKAGKISPELAKEIRTALNSTSKSLTERLPQRLSNLAGELSNIAGQVSAIDKGFGNMIGTLSNVAGSVSSIISIVNSLNDAKKNGTSTLLGSITGGLGIAGAAIGIFSSVKSLFDKQNQKQIEAYKYSVEMQMKAMDAQTSALERQFRAISDVLGTAKLDEYRKSIVGISQSYEDLTGKLKGYIKLESGAADDETVKKVNDRIDYLNSVGAEPYKSDGYYKKLSDYAAAVKDINTSAQALEELEDLMNKGLLSPEQESVVKNLIEQAKIYRETLNALKAETTGTTFEELGNSLVDLFAKGTASAEEFGKNFEEIMRKSLLNSFKRNFMDNELQKFYDKFAEYSKSGGQIDNMEYAQLKEMYDAIIAEGNKKVKEIEDIAGTSLSDNSGDASALTSNTIKAALTEDTAGRALGIWNSVYDVNKRILASIGDGNGTMAKQMEISMQHLNYAQQTAVNTANTVVRLDVVVTRLDSAVTELKGINKNTGGLSLRGSGLA